VRTRIHVNQAVLKNNRDTAPRRPVLTVKQSSGAHKNRYAHEVILRGPHGEEVARVVYRPAHPLPSRR
jgi:hypothetical protein